jgi:hypothetical protein
VFAAGDLVALRGLAGRSGASDPPGHRG